jgi:hypothetical protein
MKNRLIILFYSARRTNFKQILAHPTADQIFLSDRSEGEAKFISMKQKKDASQLLKGQSENFSTGQLLMIKA